MADTPRTPPVGSGALTPIAAARIVGTVMKPRTAQRPSQFGVGTTVNDEGNYPIPALTRPAAGGSYTDPVFGTTIIRATDATVCDSAAVVYSYWPVWNLDMTKAWWMEYAPVGDYTGANQKILYDFNTTTGACTNRRVLQASGFNLNSDGLIWSRANASLLYGTPTGNGSLQLYTLVPNGAASEVVDLTARITAVLPTASQFWQLMMGGTDRYFAGSVRDVTAQDVGFFVYDLQTDTVYARNLTGITSYDEVHLTRDGAYLLIQTSGVNAYLWDFAAHPTAPFGDVAFGQGIGHVDMGPSTGLFTADSPETSGVYAVWDLPAFYAGTKTANQASRPVCNIRHATANSGHPALHSSWENLADHEDLNLAYLSNFLVDDLTAAWKPYFDEIWKVQTDGAGPGPNGEKVRRLAHHRSSVWKATDAYGSMPKGCISTDGRWFAYTSDWDDADRIGAGPWTRRDVYLLKVPTEAEFAAGRYL